jgi:hypothetical protein
MRWTWVSAGINIVLCILLFVAYRRATKPEDKGLFLTLLVLALIAAAGSIVEVLFWSP